MLLWHGTPAQATPFVTSGTSLERLVAMAEIPVGELVGRPTAPKVAAQAKEAPAKPKTSKRRERVLGEVAVRDLVQDGEVPLAAMLEPKIATELPKTVKTAKRDERVVQIVIPEGSLDDEPIEARILDARQAAAAVAASRTAAAQPQPQQDGLAMEFAVPDVAARRSAAEESGLVAAMRRSVATDARTAAAQPGHDDRTVAAAPTRHAQAAGRPGVSPDATSAAAPSLEPTLSLDDTDAVAAAVRAALAQGPSAAPAEIAEPRAAAAKPAATNASAGKLVVVEEAGQLRFLPETLQLAKAGAKADVTILAPDAGKLAFFVRDADTLRWDGEAKSLTGLRAGRTEMYVVFNGKMYILPVIVDQVEQIDLAVPDALVSLDGLFPGRLRGSALYSGLDDVPAPSRSASAPASPSDAPSLRQSMAEVTQTQIADESRSQRYAATAEPAAYAALTLQVIDERSSVAAQSVYPAAGINVHVVGTEFVAATDSTGHLSIRDVPLRSRFMVELHDPSGLVRPGLAVVETGTEAGGVIRLKAMRSLTFDAYGSIAGVAQDAGFGSVCGSVVDRADSYAPVAGVTASLDVAANGPYYFNGYGFLDPALRTTGADGRFCFLNVAPGPVAVGVTAEDGSYLGALQLAAFEGLHREIDVVLGAERPLETRLATAPTAHEQLGADPRAASALKTIDMIDLIPLGDSAPMMYVGPGHVATPDPVLGLAGRAFAFAQAAEFEPAVYSYDLTSRDQVTPLLPRGFIDDMSFYAQVPHDPALGAVVVEHGAAAGDENGPVTFRLVDQRGQQVGDPWTYADGATTKAIVFNVPAGSYALLVETGDKYWLGGDTVLVYNETVSYVRTGGRLRYRP